MQRYALLLPTLIAFGCGGKSRTEIETKRDLMGIVLGYHWFNDQHGRAPHNAEELLGNEDPNAKAAQFNAEMQDGKSEALRSGKYVVIWDGEIFKEGWRNKGVVLAYQRDAPEKGGMVAFLDGMTGKLTKEEFEKAPKAKPPATPKK